jgi:iron complex transport system ATP-binding protein
MGYQDRSPSAYDVQGLNFRYGTGSSSDQAPWVLQGINFCVQPGEMLGIVGPNGSGKTSLLKLLAKVTALQHGSIALFGKPFLTCVRRWLRGASHLFHKIRTRRFLSV